MISKMVVVDLAFRHIIIIDIIVNILLISSSLLSFTRIDFIVKSLRLSL